MEKIAVTSTQLNNLCIYLTNNEHYYYSYVKNYFELMYKTGCRISEAINPSLWHRVGADVLILQPLKLNNNREFLISEVNCFLLDNLLNGNLTVFDLNYSKVNYHILNQIRSYDVTIRNKNSSCHLFRHNYAKQLKLQGKSDVQIKNIMGERNQSSANEYIYSEIFSTRLLDF